MAAPISSNAGASETGTSRCAAGPCAPHAAASCVAGSTLLKSAKSYLSPRDLTSRSPRPIKRFSSKFTLRLSSKFREENMENQVISTFGSAIWILVQVARSEEHTSELQSLMRISYAVFCLKKKTSNTIQSNYTD